MRCAQWLGLTQKHEYLRSSLTCVFTLLYLHFFHLNFLAEREGGVIKNSKATGKHQASWHLLPADTQPRQAAGTGRQELGEAGRPQRGPRHPSGPPDPPEPCGGSRPRGRPLSSGTPRGGRELLPAPGTGPKPTAGGRRPPPSRGHRRWLQAGVREGVSPHRCALQKQANTPQTPHSCSELLARSPTPPGVATGLRRGPAPSAGKAAVRGRPPLTSLTRRAPPSSCRPWRLLPPLTHRTRGGGAGPGRRGGRRALLEGAPALEGGTRGPLVPSTLSGRSARPALW